MFYLGDYDTAYKDIEMALKNKYPKNLGKIFFYITKKITSHCFFIFYCRVQTTSPQGRVNNASSSIAIYKKIYI